VLDQGVVAGTMPVVSVASPTLFKDVEFMPALLLPVSFDASVMASEAYQEGCEYGFFDYFERMYQVDASGLRDVFVEQFYTWADVEREVVGNVLDDIKECFPLAWSIGFEHAWLSALALTDRSLALLGLDLLIILADVVASH